MKPSSTGPKSPATKLSNQATNRNNQKGVVGQGCSSFFSLRLLKWQSELSADMLVVYITINIQNRVQSQFSAFINQSTRQEHKLRDNCNLLEKTCRSHETTNIFRTQSSSHALSTTPNHNWSCGQDKTNKQNNRNTRHMHTHTHAHTGEVSSDKISHFKEK